MEPPVSTDRKTYVPPEIETLGTPAEIVQVSKTLPAGDGSDFSFAQPFPGESTS